MKNLLLLGIIIMSMNQAAQADPKAIKQVLQHYQEATYTRDMKLLDQAFHDDFRVVALTPEGPRVLNKDTYMSLLETGKIGGVERKLDIKHIDIEGKTAHAKISLSSEKMVFNDQLQLVLMDQGWQIVNNLTQVSSIAP